MLLENDHTLICKVRDCKATELKCFSSLFKRAFIWPSAVAYSDMMNSPLTAGGQTNKYVSKADSLRCTAKSGLLHMKTVSTLLHYDLFDLYASYIFVLNTIYDTYT